MKKLFLSAIIALIAMTGMNAQDYKWWAGGRTTLWAGDDVSVIAIAPEVGYHLNSKFTIAASVGLEAYAYDAEGKSSDFGLIMNPYLRYNICRIGMVSGYMDAGVKFGVGDFEGFQTGLKPGIAIHLTDRLCAAFHFGFLGYSDGKGVTENKKGFGLDLSGYRSGFAVFYSF